MQGIVPSPGMWFIPGMAPAWGLVAGVVAAGGIAIGLPGMAAGIGSPDWVCAVAAGTGAAVGEWRLELSDTKVAAPSTSAMAPPAASPRLSRRVLRVATIGKAFWLARTSAWSLSSRRGSVAGTATGRVGRCGSSHGPRTVLPDASIVARLLVIIGHP